MPSNVEFESSLAPYVPPENETFVEHKPNVSKQSANTQAVYYEPHFSADYTKFNDVCKRNEKAVSCNETKISQDVPCNSNNIQSADINPTMISMW